MPAAATGAGGRVHHDIAAAATVAAADGRQVAVEGAPATAIDAPDASATVVTIAASTVPADATVATGGASPAPPRAPASLLHHSLSLAQRAAEDDAQTGMSDSEDSTCSSDSDGQFRSWCWSHGEAPQHAPIASDETVLPVPPLPALAAALPAEAVEATDGALVALPPAVRRQYSAALLRFLGGVCALHASGEGEHVPRSLTYLLVAAGELTPLPSFLPHSWDGGDATHQRMRRGSGSVLARLEEGAGGANSASASRLLSTGSLLGGRAQAGAGGGDSRDAHMDGGLLWAAGRVPDAMSSLSRAGSGDAHSDDASGMHRLLTPLPVLPGKRVVQLASTQQYMLFLTATGDVYQSSVTDGTPVPRLVRALALGKAMGDKRVATIACGPEHAVAVTEGGAVLTWGAGECGRLGHGDEEPVHAPRVVMALLGRCVTRVACGAAHTLVATDAGEAYTWGRGHNGRLGLGADVRDRLEPQLVAALRPHSVVAVACGWSFSAALTATGDCFCWGRGDVGQCGVAPQGAAGYALDHRHLQDQPLPVLVRTSAAAAGRRVRLVAVAAGFMHVVALGTDGEVYSWGLGDAGQLGQGAERKLLPCPLPVRALRSVLPARDPVVRVHAGPFQSFVVTNQGRVLAWGSNKHGCLGVPADDCVWSPMLVPCAALASPRQVWRALQEARAAAGAAGCTPGTDAATAGSDSACGLATPTPAAAGTPATEAGASGGADGGAESGPDMSVAAVDSASARAVHGADAAADALCATGGLSDLPLPPSDARAGESFFIVASLACNDQCTLLLLEPRASAPSLASPASAGTSSAPLASIPLDEAGLLELAGSMASGRVMGGLTLDDTPLALREHVDALLLGEPVPTLADLRAGLEAAQRARSAFAPAGGVLGGGVLAGGNGGAGSSSGGSGNSDGGNGGGGGAGERRPPASRPIGIPRSPSAAAAEAFAPRSLPAAALQRPDASPRAAALRAAVAGGTGGVGGVGGAGAGAVVGSPVVPSSLASLLPAQPIRAHPPPPVDLVTQYKQSLADFATARYGRFRTFPGSHAVQWLLARGAAQDSNEAVKVGTLLLRHRLILATDGGGVFRDDPYMTYRFCFHDTHAGTVGSLAHVGMLVALAAHMMRAVGVRDRTVRLRKVPRAFLGADAVRWTLQAGVAGDEGEAKRRLGAMVELGLFSEVGGGKGVFRGGKHLYRFALHERESESGGQEERAREQRVLEATRVRRSGDVAACAAAGGRCLLHVLALTSVAPPCAAVAERDHPAVARPAEHAACAGAVPAGHPAAVRCPSAAAVSTARTRADALAHSACSVRGRVWAMAIGNALRVTPGMFTIYCQRAAQQRRERTLAALAAAKRRAEAGGALRPSPVAATEVEDWNREGSVEVRSLPRVAAAAAL